MSKMLPEVKALWLTALRSGEYKQTTGNLKRDKADGEGIGYCCLGVLCEVAVKAGVDLKLTEQQIPAEFPCSNPECEACQEPKVEVNYQFNDNASYLPSAVQEWAGLASNNPNVRREGGYVSLAALNDSQRLNFNQIADIVDDQL